MNQIEIFSGLLIGWLSLALVFVFYKVVRGWLHRRKFGMPIDHGLLLATFGRQLTNTKDREALSYLLTEEIPAELGITYSLLLLPKAYELISNGEAAFRLPINHAAVRWVTSAGEAQLSNIGRLTEIIRQGRTDLSWAQVWVPLMQGVHLEGIWLLGGRTSGAIYSSEDLQWFTSIARGAASVLAVINFSEQERQVSSEMRSLYRQMISAREVERGRLSRELHDGVLQDLCAIVRDLKALHAKSGIKDEYHAYLANLSSDTVHALRAICNDLRPPLLLQDLTSALKALVEDMDKRSAAPVQIEFSTQQDELRLPDDIALAVFRITQEALNNALQHADASEIAVRLTEYPDRLRLTITDDGKGIPGNPNSANFVAGGHYGIAGMRERAAMIRGKLDLHTSLGYGTVVILEIAS